MNKYIDYTLEQKSLLLTTLQYIGDTKYNRGKIGNLEEASRYNIRTDADKAKTSMFFALLQHKSIKQDKTITRDDYAKHWKLLTKKYLKDKDISKEEAKDEAEKFLVFNAPLVNTVILHKQELKKESKNDR